jgi:uncharacterized protein (TIGR03083 family)
MGAVPVDPVVARAGVAAAAGQAADLVRSLPDPAAPVPGLDWTVAQTAAHLVAAARAFLGYATGQANPDATIDLGEGNLDRIAKVGERELPILADLLVADTRRFLEQTADLPADRRVPFYGGTSLELAALYGILLGEYLIHGLDLASSAGRPWPVDPAQARLVIAAAAGLLPRYLDPATASGVRSATTCASAAAPGSPCGSPTGRPPSSRARPVRWTATSRPTRSPSSKWPTAAGRTGSRCSAVR